MSETLNEQRDAGFGESDISGAFALLAEMTQDFTNDVELEPALGR